MVKICKITGKDSTFRRKIWKTYSYSLSYNFTEKKIILQFISVAPDSFTEKFPGFFKIFFFTVFPFVTPFISNLK